MLMSRQSDQEKPVVILRRKMHPPYLKATVWGDVRALTRRWRKEQKDDTIKKILSVNDVMQYVEYLRNRYPKLRPLERITSQSFRDEGLEEYFEPALENYSDFVKQQRSEITNRREAYFSQQRCCQVCSFAFTPLLQVHHVIPTAEGGDNRLLTVLCPNCHRLAHRLVAVRSQGVRRALLEFDWGTQRENTVKWWSRANVGINALVDLYSVHLEYINYDTFLQEYVRVRIHELPFVIFNPYQGQQICMTEIMT